MMEKRLAGVVGLWNNRLLWTRGNKISPTSYRSVLNNTRKQSI